MKKSTSTAAGRGRPVVPAIPLPFEKRRAAKKAAAVTPTPVPEAPISAPTTIVSDEPKVESHELAGPPEIPQQAQQTLDDSSVTADTTKTTDSAQFDDHASSEATSELPTAQINSSGASELQAVESNIDSTPTKSTSEARSPPPASPGRWQMPPPFQPGSHPVSLPPNGDQQHPPVLGGFHQSQASTSSVQFGGLVDSKNASPAPHVNGFNQPPGLPFSNGWPNFNRQNGEGPPGPYVGEANNHIDFTRPPPGRSSAGPVPGFNDVNPRVPPGFSDENGLYSRFHANGPHNGHAHSDSIRSHPTHPSISGPPGFPSAIPPNSGGPRHLMPSFEESSSLMQHVQHSFGNTDFSDAILELRFSDDRSPPVRIPSHRILLARSPRLFHVLQQQSPQNPHLVLLETTDKWIRPDAFYMAVQCLYGLPLIPVPPRNIGENNIDGAGSVGSMDDRLRFAFAYIASGHLLRWQPVVERGCEVVAALLSLDTVEKALEFVMEYHEDRGSHVTFTYGRGSEFVLHEILKFVAKNVQFMSNIASGVAKSQAGSRLPVIDTETTDDEATEQFQEPTIQLGYGPGHGHGRRSQKISGIQFGDLSVQASDIGTPKASHQVPPMFNAIISRVLLNLPFPQFKLLVEMVHRGLYDKVEQASHLMKQVLTEREKARNRAIQTVLNGEVANSEAIKMCLRSPEPRSYDNWSVLGWKEWETHEGFHVGRTWVPLQDERNSPVAEFP